MDIKSKILDSIDITYSYNLAKKMEEYRTNEVLGYRTAGSLAEYKTGLMLEAEMKNIGLSDVTRDEITVDKWEFEFL